MVSIAVMVKRTYSSLGPVEVCVEKFNALIPHVEQIRRMQALFPHMSADDFALEIAVDSLETAAYHFTRRRLYYEQVRTPRAPGQNYFPGFADRGEAIAAFEALRPYRMAIAKMGENCRPFGRDSMALSIAYKGLATAAYHFTKIDGFYGARGDSATPSRPLTW